LKVIEYSPLSSHITFEGSAETEIEKIKYNTKSDLFIKLAFIKVSAL
jgi:hypothetical protein